MKTQTRIASLVLLFILCLVLGAPAFAGTTTLYSNGPINGDINAWYINYGYLVSDSFTVNMSAATQFSFGVWVLPGDQPSTVQWSIGTTPYGSDVASGTATNLWDNGLSTDLGGNAWGYDVWNVSFIIPSTPLTADTYYFTLQNATTTKNYGIIGWDENDGPSIAYQSGTGTIGSEAFGVFGTNGGPWTKATTFPGSGAGAAWLMTDGTVIVHEEPSNTQNWWKLTPTSSGSYASGTWSHIPSPPGGYAPEFFGSAVLPDGRLIVEGGEYNNGTLAYSNRGAVYNPATNTWQTVNPPAGWSTIGAGQSIVLPNGTYMQANCCTKQAALLNASNLTWSATGSGKADENDNEAYTLLPNGRVQTVDTYVSSNLCGGTEASELYTSSGIWTCGPYTPTQLWDNVNHIMGPAVLRPDGTLFQTGAVSETAIYHSGTNTWTAGPTFPNNLDVAYGPAALETNGKVLVMTSPDQFQTGAVFYEFDGTHLSRIAGPNNSPSDSSFYGHMVELPSGQILFTDFSKDVEVFTPTGSYSSAWAPTITSYPATVTHGHTNYSISGLRLAGMSQGAAYGNAYQSATNYALVRLTNTITHRVVYARTHNPSSYQVQSGSTQSTEFDVPSTIDLGTTTLVIVTNGIPSAPETITVN